MGRAKRCRSVVIGASVAALGAAGPCPTATAASSAAPAPRAGVAHEHARRHRPQRATAQRGPYVYEALVESTEATAGRANMVCAASGARLVSVALSGEGNNSFQLWERDPAAWNKAYTVTVAPSATVTVSWTPPAERREAEAEADANHGEIRNPRLQGRDDTTTVAALCAATSPDAGVAELGRAVVTWRLPAPARSLAALTATTPTSIRPLEYSDDFEVLPNGSVPAFAPYGPTA